MVNRPSFKVNEFRVGKTPNKFIKKEFAGET